MQHELRYRGELLGFHASREAAESHAREHHGYGRKPDEPRQAEHHAQDPEALSIEPRRPLSLFVRGNLVDTFTSRDEGNEALARIVSESGRRISAEVCELVEGDAPSPVPDPAT